MKKGLLYSILCLFLCSCKGSFWIKFRDNKELNYNLKEDKMDKKTEITYHYGKKIPFILDNETIFIPCKIDDSTRLLIYYSERDYNLFEKIPANAKFPKSYKTVKMSKQSLYVKKGLKYYNIETDFFSFKNCVGRLYATSNNIPNKNNLYLCTGRFPDWKNTMLLNFSDTTITLLDSISTYDTTGFIPVKSVFSCVGILLYLQVDSIDYYRFVFSTTSKDFLSLPQQGVKAVFVNEDEYKYVSYPLYEKHKKENDVSIMRFNDKNGLDTLIVQQTNAISMGNLNFINGTILYTKDFIDPPVMGMQFISNFDWIIDRNKKKIYAKPIKDNFVEQHEFGE